MDTEPTHAGRNTIGGNQPRHTRRHVNNDDDDDDDVAINSERISLKCPITLLRFKDPVTSTKCPHSFERQAIEDMIRNGTAPARGGRRNQHHINRSVQCPVCSVLLTMQDLRADPVLVRRVRRANEMDARDDDDDDDEDEEEGDEDDEEEEGGDLMVASQRRKRRSLADVKGEKSREPSRIPDTQC
jgi:hypothetical protein